MSKLKNLAIAQNLNIYANKSLKASKLANCQICGRLVSLLHNPLDSNSSLKSNFHKCPHGFRCRRKADPARFQSVCSICHGPKEKVNG